MQLLRVARKGYGCRRHVVHACTTILDARCDMLPEPLYNIRERYLVVAGDSLNQLLPAIVCWSCCPVSKVHINNSNNKNKNTRTKYSSHSKHPQSCTTCSTATTLTVPSVTQRIPVDFRFIFCSLLNYSMKEENQSQFWVCHKVPVVQQSAYPSTSSLSSSSVHS